jgi:hypothetical protein
MVADVLCKLDVITRGGGMAACKICAHIKTLSLAPFHFAANVDVRIVRCCRRVLSSRGHARCGVVARGIGHRSCLSVAPAALARGISGV